MADDSPQIDFASADFEPAKAAFQMTLMARPMRTPKGKPFEVPSADLAAAVMDEWRAQEGNKIRYERMPLTRICFGSIDLVPNARDQMTQDLLAYVSTDMIFFRVTEPEGLRRRQDAHLMPICEWLSQTCGCPVEITDGLSAVTQDPAIPGMLENELAALDDFQLTAFDVAARLTGSLCTPAALMKEAIGPEDAWAASRVDEEWQIERWGRDKEAETRVSAQKKDFLAAVRMLELLRS